MKKQYHVFISYSHRDKEYARVIQKSIETLGLPFYKKWKPNVAIFRDERKIPLAGDLSNAIKKGLEESNYLLIIASKNSALSTWVKAEVLLWHELNKDEHGHIKNFNFILIDDVVEWDHVNKDFDKLKTTALPIFDTKIFKNLPVWSNIQHYCKDGKIQTKNLNYEWEIAKIKAFLLGRTPDQIIDETAKSKNLFRILLIVITFLMTFLTLFAYKQRAEAFKEKENAQTSDSIAQIEKSNAEKQAKKAITSDSIAQIEKNNAKNETKKTKTARDSVIAARLKIQEQSQKISFETKLKQQLSDSRNFLKNYLMEYDQFKKQQLFHSSKQIYNNIIYFDIDKYNIRPDAAVDLVQALELLRQNPSSIIFLETCQLDDESDEIDMGYDYGLHLSKRRAESIKSWLIKNGISIDRVKINGTVQYIKSLANKTEEEKQRYRKCDIFIYNL